MSPALVQIKHLWSVKNIINQLVTCKLYRNISLNFIRYKKILSTLEFKPILNIIYVNMKSLKSELLSLYQHQENMSLKCIPPYTPLSYSKTGVCRGIPIFLIFASKHRLCVPTIHVLSKNKKNNKKKCT